MNKPLISSSELQPFTANVLTAEQIVPKSPPWWLTLAIAAVCTAVLAFVSTLQLPTTVKALFPLGLVAAYGFLLLGIIQATVLLIRIRKWKAKTNEWYARAEHSCLARASHELDDSVPMHIREQALAEFQASLEKCLYDRCQPLLCLSFLISLIPVISFGLASRSEAATDVNHAMFWVALGLAGGTIVWFESLAIINTGRGTIRAWYDAACLRWGITQREAQAEVLKAMINKQGRSQPTEPADETNDILTTLPVTPPAERRKPVKTKSAPEDDLVIEPQSTPAAKPSTTKPPGTKSQDEPEEDPGNEDCLGGDPLQDM